MIIIIATLILTGLIFAPLGCLSLWKKYTYFTDGFSHASILAGSISVMLGIPIIYAGIIFAVLFSFAIFKYKDISDGNISIGLVSNFMLSVALIILYISPTKIEIEALLFGDILSASTQDVIILSFLLLIISMFFIIYYRQIILLIINRDMAQIMGVKVQTIELLFLILLSVTVFSTIKVVGALFVTGMLLIPTMIAWLVSSTPKNMIYISTIIALLLNMYGISISFYFDIPVAPVIICTGALVYFICSFCLKCRRFS